MVTNTTGSLFSPVTVALADFNGDRNLDMAVSDVNDSSVHIFLGNGDGTFRRGANYSIESTVSLPYIMRVSNLNNDTRPDLIVANLLTRNVDIFLGNGDGTFQSQIVVSTGADAYPTDVTVGDVNNDGRLDLVVSNYLSNTVGVFLGVGNGTFQAQRTLSTGGDSSPASVVIRDFDNDNQSDIAVINSENSSVAVFLGYGNGFFRSPITTNISIGVAWLGSSDFNGDGKHDVVVLGTQNKNLAILFGNGDGTFRFSSFLLMKDDSFTYYFDVVDMNNDGRQDIVVPDEFNGNIVIFLSNSDGSFQAQKIFPTGANIASWWTAAGDFNNDNRLDIAVANENAGNVGILLASC